MFKIGDVVTCNMSDNCVMPVIKNHKYIITNITKDIEWNIDCYWLENYNKACWDEYEFYAYFELDESLTKLNESNDIEEKVFYVASSTMFIKDGDSEFSYSKTQMKHVFKSDPDLPIINQKMDNLIALFSQKKKNSEEFEEFLGMDFQTEIWYMI